MISRPRNESSESDLPKLAIPGTGRQVYQLHYQAEWLARITEAGVRRRAELYFQQLDALAALRQGATQEPLIRPEAFFDVDGWNIAKSSRKDLCAQAQRSNIIFFDFQNHANLTIDKNRCIHPGHTRPVCNGLFSEQSNMSRYPQTQNRAAHLCSTLSTSEGHRQVSCEVNA